MKQGTVGFDIEFFVANNKDGLIRPVCGLIGGDKHSHVKLGDYEVHEDNVALEVNSPVFTEPRKCLDWLINLKHGINDALDEAKHEIHLAQQRWQQVILFPKAVLETVGPQALQIGCDPDFSGYNEGTLAPRELKLGNFEQGNRYVGAHIHLGYSTHSEIAPHYIAKLLHLISVWAGVQSAGKRAELYGNGLFRPKPYGIEYRSISTGNLLSESGLSFVAAAFNLVNILETRPQEAAEVYSQLSSSDWKLLAGGKAPDKLTIYIHELINETFASEREKVGNMDALHSEDFYDVPPIEEPTEKALKKDIKGLWASSYYESSLDASEILQAPLRRN